MVDFEPDNDSRRFERRLCRRKSLPGGGFGGGRRGPLRLVEAPSD
jgi:hypothetical protein